MNAEELLVDIDWLSQLARQLVRDPALADDAVQEAWLSASRRLRARGIAARPNRGLLLRTLRGAVMQARRAARRRRFHEEQSARPEALPSTGELLLVGERQQTLWRHLAELDEPYRSTLLLRFQRGLKPALLAGELDIKEDSVRWRIRRGLELLAASLEREEHGPGLMGMVPVAALAFHPLPQVAVAGGAAAGMPTLLQLGVPWMANKLIYLGVSAAVAVLGAAWFLHDANVHHGSRNAAMGGSEAAPDGTGGRLSRNSEPVLAPPRLAPEGRHTAASSASHEAKPAATLTQSVATGQVVDRQGRPLAGVRLTIERQAGWKREGVTGNDGRFEIACPIQTAQSVVLSVPAFDHFSQAQCSLGSATGCAFPALTVPRLDVGEIVLNAAGVVRGRLVEEDGTPVIGVTVDAKPRYFGVKTDEDGAFCLRGRRLGENFLVIRSRKYSLRGVPIELNATEVVDLGDIVLATYPEATVRGTVTDQEGQPVALATVSGGDSETLTLPNGSYELKCHTADLVLVQAVAEGYRDSHSVDAADGAELDFILHGLGPEHRFQVVDRRTGLPIEGARLRVEEKEATHDKGLGDGTRRYARASDGSSNESAADGLLRVGALANIDEIVVSAPGYSPHTSMVGHFDPAGRAMEIRLAEQLASAITGTLPVGARGATLARLEIHDLARLSLKSPDNGSAEAPVWIQPPPSIRQSSDVGALFAWMAEDPTLEVLAKHLIHADDAGNFKYVSTGSETLHRVVGYLRGGGIVISRIFCAKPEATTHIVEFEFTQLGSLHGAVTLPHPRFLPEVTLTLEGRHMPKSGLNALGEYQLDGLIPGQYRLLPESLPWAMNQGPFTRIVAIEPGAVTRLDIDPEIPPYGEVDFTLLVNGRPPELGYTVTLLGEGEHSYYYSDETPSGAARLFVPAATGYRVLAEPNDAKFRNSSCEVTGTFDVSVGTQSYELNIETAHLVCEVGERHHATVTDSWQNLLWKDAEGIEREPIEVAENLVFDISPNAERRTIILEFLHVPVGAKDLRFAFEGPDDEVLRVIPIDVDLVPGKTARITVE